MKRFLTVFGGIQPDANSMEAILTFLVRPAFFLIPQELYGARDHKRLLQVNHETIRLYYVPQEKRMRCSVCGEVRSGAPNGYPCSRCHGYLSLWTDLSAFQNRSAVRIIKDDIVPLIAGEHTAQVTTEARAQLEETLRRNPKFRRPMCWPVHRRSKWGSMSAGWMPSSCATSPLAPTTTLNAAVEQADDRG